MSERKIPAMWMRGGTSKGGYFLASDLPNDPAERDALLLRIMGSPDPRQIDGMGGGDSLTSKAAIVRPSAKPGIDVDYLFLQVMVERAQVSDSQNCGNILAGVAPFAIERNLVQAKNGATEVVIGMENTGQTAITTVQTPGGKITYEGDTRIDGVPFPAAAMPIVFPDAAGSSCGAMLPTGNAVDRINGFAVTLIDYGMPCIIINAADFDISGEEPPDVLDANDSLRAGIEDIRKQAGPLMNLGDVSDKTVPKVALVSPAAKGGALSVRCFIPRHCHKAIGALAAVSIGVACMLDEGPAAALYAVPPEEDGRRKLVIEHPSGQFPVTVEVGASGKIARAGIIRTARKLMDGFVFV